MTVDIDSLSESLMTRWAQDVQNESIDHNFEGHFITNIYAWVQTKRKEIQLAFEMQGGWEGWLQVELALWLMRAGFGVEREVHVYNDVSNHENDDGNNYNNNAQKKEIKAKRKKAADLLITTPFRPGEIPVRTIVELKCESLFQDFNMRPGEPNEDRQDFSKESGFVKRIEADLTKFGVDGQNIRSEYRGAYYCCIGISVTFDAWDYVVGSRCTRFHPISRERLMLHAAEWGVINEEEAEQAEDDNLMIWWSSLHVKG